MSRLEPRGEADAAQMHRVFNLRFIKKIDVQRIVFSSVISRGDEDAQVVPRAGVRDVVFACQLRREFDFRAAQWRGRLQRNGGVELDPNQSQSGIHRTGHHPSLHRNGVIF